MTAERQRATSPEMTPCGGSHADAVLYRTNASTVTGPILYVDGGAHFGRW